MPKPASVRDTSIGNYRAKRDFGITSEPAPAEPKPGTEAPLFVVQKHAAKRAGLHWDLRLEHGGVLWSWAVRKGPSLDPADRRLAAHVEDHPLDYADFQGAIPEGQYGAGTVETWDRGSWAPLGDPDAGMRKGDLQFVLHGQRLRGRFHLVRLKRRERERQDAWFLIKGHDEHERPGVDALTLEAEIPFRSPEQAPADQRAETPPAPGAVRDKAVRQLGIERPVVVGHSWGRSSPLLSPPDIGRMNRRQRPTARPWPSGAMFLFRPTTAPGQMAINKEDELMPVPGEVSEEQIRERAYALWESAGRPDGRSEEFWDRAERELTGEARSPVTLIATFDSEQRAQACLARPGLVTR